jgi:uncharacterized protein
VNSDVLAEALLRIADDVAQEGISGGTHNRAARELLLARPPRLRTGAFQAHQDEEAARFAIRIAAELDDTVLAIQGPPGAGKTFTGAQMICELVRRGARVGVTAVSHKVIRNLLDAVVKAADEARLQMKCAHKVTTKSDPPSDIDEITDNSDVITQLSDGQIHVVGGTQWLWARPDARASVDVLFVDEAGQMSLANVLAALQAAHSVVLLGDPQQLEQPQQGSHPVGTDVSALEHILQGHKTISSDRGIFLPETWRLAPSICAFTSEVFYEGRLHVQRMIDEGRLDEIPEFLQRSSLTETERTILGRIHPAFMGGEYLPSMEKNEVEIAGIEISSTTSDVTSVFARRAGERIRYRVVDEYDGDTLSDNIECSSDRPLTLGELETFFWTHGH